MSSKLNLPPNNCMPSSAKMTMNKKSSSSKLAMERILFSSEATRLRSEFQYLIMGPELYIECSVIKGEKSRRRPVARVLLMLHILCECK